MRRVSCSAICIFVLLTMASASAGEVIDSVVATVNHRPIFRSDWDEAIRFEAFMQQEQLGQVTEAAKATALQRLIDRQLIEAEMGDARYMQPTDEDLQRDVTKLRAQVPGGAADQSWQKLLASYGLTTPMLQDHLRTELQVMNFVEVRLRPNVRIQPEEIQAYYQDQVVPDLQRVGGKIVSLPEVEPRIRELLTQQHMDQLLDAWLHNLRQQAKIQTTVPLPAGNAADEQIRVSGAP
jgi:hypothetical protein